MSPPSCAMHPSTRRGWRRPPPVAEFALACWLALGLSAGSLLAQEAPAPHATPAATDAEHEGEAHGESWGALVSRLANFVILAGGLWYFLRRPTGRYLEGRSTGIREGLENAAELKIKAATQIRDVEAKMHALPAELEALRARGAEEIKVEEARIRRAAEEDRTRLLDQMRREIDLQVQAARRDLRREAADLAVQIARRRVAATIDENDQRRLIGRYISQVQRDGA